ncbi:MAG TPA: NAD(P)-dependent oxidoreductase [Terriglobales bacterium]|nr:NAD(P)-dependent oxidoreductase [Terriglobales bacterium]
MHTGPKLSAEQLEENFADINPPLTPSMALEEASRCLFCYDAPCIKACPTRIDVPQFIRQIVTKNLVGSAQTILSANVLGHSCGRVCPTSVLCEGACVLNVEGKKPVEIGRLQRYSVDHVLGRGIPVLKPSGDNGRRVALIGAGPASLACAAELRQMGYATVIFDAKPAPGGLNTYGIAAYKMRAAEALREIEMIRQLGVEIRCSVNVGTDIPLAQLERGYDAIFIGVGLGGTENLGIPGEELHGCRDALSFIEDTKISSLAEVQVGRRIAVIGGGNTAIDVVTAARRLGAETVYMIYRRSREEMTAFDYEYELAVADGVSFVWQAMPVRILGDAQNRVYAIECVRTQMQAGNGSGRAFPEPIAGSEFQLEVDMVVKALGQKSLQFLRSIPGLGLEPGRVVVNAESMQTGNPRYFAGGDCVNGGAEVVDAVAHGKRAAQGIHSALEASRKGVAHA